MKSSEPIKGKSMSADAFRARVETFRKYLEASDAVRRRWDAHFREARDRGIVIAAGRAGAILNAYVVIHTLRHATGCRLPVVVAHYGEAEFRATTREYFAAAFDDISFVDLEQVEYPTHHVPLESGGSRRELGYKLKIYPASSWCRSGIRLIRRIAPEPVHLIAERAEGRAHSITERPPSAKLLFCIHYSGYFQRGPTPGDTM